MSVFAALDVFDDRELRSAAMQMAVDEALLERLSNPALRFYGWRAPAVSFGYFGRFADVAAFGVEREIVRRWTGGGVVLHGEDLTYSLIVPAADAFAGRSSRHIYVAVHEALRGTLRSFGIGATLAGESAPKISEACFANPVRADVLLDGHKAAGAAQRRTRTGLLHQGSIQIPALDRTFAAAFAAQLCATCRDVLLPAGAAEAAILIAEKKYATREWLMCR